MLRRRISIASLLSFILVLLVTAVLTGFGVFGYRAIREREHGRLRAAIDVLADQLSVALTLPAWNFDHDQIDRIIEGGMQQKDIDTIVVRLAGRQPKAHSRTRDRAWQIKATADRDGESGQFQVSRSILIDGKVLGTVEVVATPRFVEDSLARTRTLMITFALVLDAVLLLGVYLLLWIMVFKPLREIERYAQAVDAPAGGVEKLNGRNFVGEMDSLRISLEAMIDLLGLRFIALQKSEEQSRANEAQYRHLFQQMISGLMVFEVIFDAQGTPCDYKLVRGNPASGKLTGLNVAEKVGKTGTEFSMGWPFWLREKFYRVASSGEPIQYERFNETLGRYFETRVFSPSPGHFAHVFNDISERKRIETALIDSAERLRLSLRLSGLGVWRRDLQTGAGEWDERMNVIFGRDTGRTAPTQDEFYKLILPEDLPAIKIAWQNFIEGRGVYDLNFRIVRPNGEKRHVTTQAMVQKDESGRPISVIGVNADLTDFVRMTEESVLLRDRLRQAQKMETLGTLAAGIAHDFNNLLTGINGFVELGASTLPADHEAVAMLKQARHGAMSARDLVRRILDFSRKVPDAEKIVVNLTAFIREIALFITTGLPAQVTLSFDIDEDTPSVRADTGQIQQVLMNLCVNGAHAIGGHGGCIRVTLSERKITGDLMPGQSGPAAPGHYACLSVADTGCGMSAEVSTRIFEPFYTTKKSGEGTGLGLAVVQDIVVDHGGFIRVVSEEGKGTTFEIFLPATTVKHLSPKPVSSDAGARGRGERILIVDDEPFVTAVAQRALKHAGYRPESYNSAPEGWARFETAAPPFDLLLLDHQMPELTGEEIVFRVREAGNPVPIICMSARISEMDGDKLRQLEGIGFLSKPFDIDTLLERVAVAFGAIARD